MDDKPTDKDRDTFCIALEPDDKLIYEDDKARYYINSTTKSLSRGMEKGGYRKGLEGYRVVQGEVKKTGERHYLLCDPKGEIVDGSTQIDGMGLIIDIINTVRTGKVRND